MRSRLFQLWFFAATGAFLLTVGGAFGSVIQLSCSGTMSFPKIRRCTPDQLKAIGNMTQSGTNDLARTWLSYCLDPMEHAQIAPTPTIIDLDQKLARTPLGDLAISEQTQIGLELLGKEAVPDGQTLFIFGALNRSTGKLNLWWLPPGEEAKRQKGMSFQASKWADLSCKAALF